MNFVDGVLSPDELAPYIEDALNQIEFLTGPTDTTYRALRASLGYSEPWNIKYVQIGNEGNVTGGLESYEAYRLQMFYDAIRERYPNMVILASASEFTMNLTNQKSAGISSATRSPMALRGPKTSADSITLRTRLSWEKWPACSPTNPGGTTPSFEDYVEYPFWIGSVSEAVFLLGAERNSDRVIGVAYAPLLGHAEGNPMGS